MYLIANGNRVRGVSITLKRKKTFLHTFPKMVHIDFLLCDRLFRINNKINWKYPQNRQQPLPTQRAIVLWCSLETGITKEQFCYIRIFYTDLTNTDKATLSPE